MLGLTLWRGYVEFFLPSYTASLTFFNHFLVFVIRSVLLFTSSLIGGQQASCLSADQPPPCCPFLSSCHGREVRPHFASPPITSQHAKCCTGSPRPKGRWRGFGYIYDGWGEHWREFEEAWPDERLLMSARARSDGSWQTAGMHFLALSNPSYGRAEGCFRRLTLGDSLSGIEK